MALEAPIAFGAGVSLRLASDDGAFVASPGFADPRMIVRKQERPSFPLSQFDRCVFRFAHPAHRPHVGESAKKVFMEHRPAATSPYLTYGRTVCIVHAYSGLYVTVVRKPSSANASHFSVVLMSQEDAGSACRFRVMPRYKIRTEGDRVCDKDMVYLQQESSHLSIHAGTTNSPALGHDEVECTACDGAGASSFEVNVYDEADQTNEAQRHAPLRAGCAALVFHREKDALLTVLLGGGDRQAPRRSAGSPVTPTTRRARSMTFHKNATRNGASTPPPTTTAAAAAASPSAPPLPPNTATTTTTTTTTTDTSICFHHYDKPVTNLSADQMEYGCNALWFFENIDPSIGGTIEPNSPFRLRHGATGLYLSLPEAAAAADEGSTPDDGHPVAPSSFRFTELTTLDALESTVFELEVVSSGGASLTKVFSGKSFVRIVHRQTRRYLTSFRDGATNISYLRSSPHSNLEDAVTVLMVPRARQQELSYLIGNVEFLSSYIKLFYAMQDPHCTLKHSDVLVTRVVQRAAASLSALIRFCTESEDDDPLTREGLPIPTHQQSMFEVHLHRIVMDVLLCPFVAADKENKMELPLVGGVLSISNLLDEKLEHVHKVCRLCYRLLKQMSKGSPYAAQLVDYVSFMQAQEGYKLHVADTQLEIFTNNPFIPPERCQSNIRHFVNLLLTKERSSGYLRFLSSLCVVNGTGIPQNQVLVATLLLQEYSGMVLYPLTLKDSVLMVLVPPAAAKKKKAAGTGVGGSSGGGSTRHTLPGGTTDASAASPVPATPATTTAASVGPVWVALDDFLKSGDAKMIKFFESSVELLGNLVIGSDPATLRLVRDFISQEHITAAISPEVRSCSESLRASFFLLALHLYAREGLQRGSVNSVVRAESASCGALVRPSSAQRISGQGSFSESGAMLMLHTPTLNRRGSESLSSAEESRSTPGATIADHLFLSNLKHKGLAYLEQLREKETQSVGSDLVLVISDIWHTVVAYDAYNHDELVEAVRAVIGCLDTTNVARNPERYKRTEDTDSSMKMKQGLCSFLSTVLEHEVSRITDTVLSDLANEESDGAAAMQRAAGLIDELKASFLCDKLLPILMDLMYYESKSLVAAAVELSLSLCNVHGTLAARVRTAEVIRHNGIAALEMFFRVKQELQQNLSASGQIINEESLIVSVRRLTSYDPTEQSDLRQSAAVRQRRSRRSAADDGEGDRNDAEEDEDAAEGRTAASAARVHRALSHTFLKAAQAVQAAQRMSAMALEKRSRWRRTASNLEEYSRLMNQSHLQYTLLRILHQQDCTVELHSVLLEFFRILSISNAGASFLGAHMQVFVKFLQDETTQEDAAAILLRITEVNPYLAEKLDLKTVSQLTQLLVATRDPSIAEGLEHVALGEYPVPRNQALIVAQLTDAKVLESFRGVSLDKLTADQLAFRSAVIDLAACCCINNSSCRSLISQTVAADDLIHILDQSALPPDHLIPYYKLLASAFMSTEDDSTAQELQLKRRHWADNGHWWRLVEGRIWTLLSLEDDSAMVANAGAAPFGGGGGGSVAFLPQDSNVVFLGVIPLLTFYYANLFGPAQCSKSKVAVPLVRVVRRVTHFAERFLRSKHHMQYATANQLAVLSQLLSVLSHHMDAKHELTGAVQQWKLCADSEHAARIPKRGQVDVRHHRIVGAEAFEEWTCNSEDALRPLLRLWSPDGDGCLYKAATAPRVRQLHELLVQHITMGAFSEYGLKGVMAVLRQSITQYEEGSAAMLEAQNYINNIGVLRMITETAFKSTDEAGSESFRLGAAILEGGNRVVQDQLLGFFTSTDERFFHETSSYIDLCTKRARQSRACEGYLSFYANSVHHHSDVSFGNLELNLRLLQLMCEGHHLGLQDYLRVQQDNLRSVNVVKEIVRLLEELVLHEVTEDASFSLLLQVLNALTEFCQGPCTGNQKLIASCGGCHSIHTILTAESLAITAPFSSERSQRMLQLKSSAMTMLLALLEGNEDDTIATVVVFEVHVAALAHLVETLVLSQEFILQTDETVCELVYHLMILMHTLVNSVDVKSAPEAAAPIEDARGVLQKLSRCCGMLGKIEIERNDRIERVYFRVPTICSLLTEETKDRVLWALDRSSQGSKLSDFLDKADEVIFDLEAMQRVTEKMASNRIFLLVAKWPLGIWDDVSLTIAVLMNLLFVAVVSDARGLLDKNVEWLGAEGVIRLLAHLQLAVCLVIAFMDGSLNYPLILYKQSKAVHHPTALQKAKALLSRNETMYRTTNVLFALMGFVISDFFFAFHLLGLITKSSVLKNVIVAVTQNGRSLVLTGLLGGILVYLFSIIGFVIFQDHFEDGGCRTLGNCVLHILTTGLRQGGGIGDKMREVKHDDPSYLQRTLYDFLFWALMIVIFLNILFGLILDTFAELRDEKSKKEEDMRTKCFICGIEAYTFDRYGSGFGEHVHREHNMWQYLYFLHHLRRKESTEFTGQESYVAACVAKGDISFFPAGKCLSLKAVHVGGQADGDVDDGALADGVGGGAGGLALPQRLRKSTASGGAGAVVQGEFIGDGAREGKSGKLITAGSSSSSTGSFVAAPRSSGGVDFAAVLVAQNEQTLGALARMTQRMEAMEKASASASSVVVGGGGGGSFPSSAGRLQRLESNLSREETGHHSRSTASGREDSRSGATSPTPRECTTSSITAVPASGNDTGLEWDARRERSRAQLWLSNGNEKLVAHVQAVDSLADICRTAKSDAFAQAVQSQMSALWSSLRALQSQQDRHWDVGGQEAEGRVAALREREELRLRQMMRAIDCAAGSSGNDPSPIWTEGGASSSIGSHSQLRNTSPDVVHMLATTSDMSTLMKFGHEYVARVRLANRESRGTHLQIVHGFPGVFAAGGNAAAPQLAHPSS